MHRWSLLLLALSSIGCATFKPHYTYTRFGDADPVEDAEVVRRAHERVKPAEPVRVLVDTLPEGLERKDGVLSVAEGYQHQIIGSFSVVTHTTPWISTLFFFPDYEDGWRKGYCYPQTVLNYATLSLWSMVVPLAFPCWGTLFPARSKLELIERSRELTGLVGGDLAIVSFTTAVANDEAFSVAGFILRADPRLNEDGKPRAPPQPQAALLLPRGLSPKGTVPGR